MDKKGKKFYLPMILLLVVLMIIIIIALRFNKGEIDTTNALVVISNVEYDDNNELIKEQGYVIYKDGIVKKYDNIRGIQRSVKQLSSQQINEIVALISNIDIMDISYIMTSVAVNSGTNIYVYSEGTYQLVQIKGIYFSNMSEAAAELNRLLRDYGYLD